MSKLSGEEKVAVLLMSVDDDSATSILQGLEDEHILKISNAIAALRNVSVQEVQEVLQEFIRDTEKSSGPLVGSVQNARRILENAFEGKTPAYLFAESESHTWKQLRQLSGDIVVELIEDEHPQIIALILSRLDNTVAAHVLEVLRGKSAALVSDILYRILNSRSPTKESMYVLSEALESKLGSRNLSLTNRYKTLASIIGSANKDVMQSVMQELHEYSPSCATKIRGMLISFEDIVNLSIPHTQEVIRKCQMSTLAVALHNCNEKIKKHILSTMPKKTSEMLLDSLDDLSSLSKEDSEDAKTQIAELMLQLSETGLIKIQKI